MTGVFKIETCQMTTLTYFTLSSIWHGAHYWMRSQNIIFRERSKSSCLCAVSFLMIHSFQCDDSYSKYAWGPPYYWLWIAKDLALWHYDLLMAYWGDCSCSSIWEGLLINMGGGSYSLRCLPANLLDWLFFGRMKQII